MLWFLACTAPSDSGGSTPFTAVTFNTGTTEGLDHDAAPDDGYTGAHAAVSDAWYGDGLAWSPAVAAVTTWMETVQPDVVGVQELFWAGGCSEIPAEHHPDFFCEDWARGDASVLETVLGPDFQIACHPGKPDKCVAVRSAWARIRGCEDAVCMDGLDGWGVEGCGQGARVARAELDLRDGSELVVVHVHGSSGLSADDQACRVAQVDQVFVDLGDGRPGVLDGPALVLGDLNTDPHRFLASDDSAQRWAEHIDQQGFHWLTQVGPDAPGSYAGLADIDHMASDSLTGDCTIAGVQDALPAVLDAVYFDHHPVVCTLSP